MARNPPTGADGDHATFCRICEAFCGIVATVEGGRVTAVRPDRANPHSQGHACIKAVAMLDVMYDPDRVTRPLKRVGGPGAFAPVSWDEALDDVAVRLKGIRAEHGGDAIAGYLGNPTGYSTNAFSSFGAFLSLLGSKKLYGAGSQDSAARLTAFFMIHGRPHYTAIPDLVQCDFLLMLGANPLVSNGWMVWNPRWKHDLATIAARGRVVVVDPRATETASRHEHWPIRPDGDVWLLIGLMRVLFGAGSRSPTSMGRSVSSRRSPTRSCPAPLPIRTAGAIARGWQLANETPGANVNVLLGLGVESVEFVSGMTLIDCLDVTVTRVAVEQERERA